MVVMLVLLLFRRLCTQCRMRVSFFSNQGAHVYIVWIKPSNVLSNYGQLHRSHSIGQTDVALSVYRRSPQWFCSPEVPASGFCKPKYHKTKKRKQKKKNQICRRAAAELLQLLHPARPLQLLDSSWLVSRLC